MRRLKYFGEKEANMKRLISALFIGMMVTTLFAQLATESQRKFIKGNIADKTAAIREASVDEVLAQAGLDFAIGNRQLLGVDRDLSALAVASILSLPMNDSSQKASDALAEKLVQAFNLFEDETVKIAVLDKMVTATYISPKSVALVNGYLASARSQNATTRAAINAAGKIGNSKTFEIIYDAWRTDRWNQFKSETDDALIALSAASLADAARVHFPRISLARDGCSSR